MIRTKDNWLDSLEMHVSLADKMVIEVGSGDGARSATIAARCKKLFGIEPDEGKVLIARARNIPNARFSVAGAHALRVMPRHAADIVMFPLSFHHIPAGQMQVVIDYAHRAVHKNGRIIFLEPGTAGSFFRAEIDFDACDGDESLAKARAYTEMRLHPRLIPACEEIHDTTEWEVASIMDFIAEMAPKKNQNKIGDFLQVRGFKLMAHRRINIYRPA